MELRADDKEQSLNLDEFSDYEPNKFFQDLFEALKMPTPVELQRLTGVNK